ncbi:hypothetical protein [Plectonema phage JingP1]|uniref:Uncharacterized protein n=1 Tax=Plectonema phage JingP1 TaxID=2961687 RepID=A0A9E7SZE7_9CAUD|nr:hypothetical protein [Plectonema phage JingP1]
MKNYAKLPARDPQQALYARGYTYLGFYHPKYVNELSGAKVDGYYITPQKKALELAGKLSAMGFTGRTVKMMGVNWLVVIEGEVEHTQQEEW